MASEFVIDETIKMKITQVTASQWNESIATGTRDQKNPQEAFFQLWSAKLIIILLNIKRVFSCE